MGRLILSPSPWCEVHIVAGKMEGDIGACFEGGNNFNNKLKDALTSLMTNVNSNKSEIDALRGDHDQLRKDHDALEVRTTRPGSRTLQSSTESSTLRTEPERLKLPLWTPSQRVRMMLVRMRLQI